jgi:hypothetical protein
MQALTTKSRICSHSQLNNPPLYSSPDDEQARYFPDALEARVAALLLTHLRGTCAEPADPPHTWERAGRRASDAVVGVLRLAGAGGGAPRLAQLAGPALAAAAAWLGADARLPPKVAEKPDELARLVAALVGLAGGGGGGVSDFAAVGAPPFDTLLVFLLNVVESAAGELLAAPAPTLADDGAGAGAGAAFRPAAAGKGKGYGKARSVGAVAMESLGGRRLLCECANALALLLSQGLSARRRPTRRTVRGKGSGNDEERSSTETEPNEEEKGENEDADGAEDGKEGEEDEEKNEEEDASTTAVVGALCGLARHKAAEVALVAVRSLKDVAGCLSDCSHISPCLYIAHIRQVRSLCHILVFALVLELRYCFLNTRMMLSLDSLCYDRWSFVSCRGVWRQFFFSRCLFGAICSCGYANFCPLHAPVLTSLSLCSFVSPPLSLSFSLSLSQLLSQPPVCVFVGCPKGVWRPRCSSAALAGAPRGRRRERRRHVCGIWGSGHG